jgi:RNA polymerase sigma-54 factor
MKAIDEGWELLSRRSYNELSRRLHIPTSQAIKLVAFISENLNPFPARAHWGEFQQSEEKIPTYSDPDIIISQIENDPNSPLVVEVVSPYAGSLRVNPLFRQAISQAPAERSHEWQSELDEAVLLVKCLQQRNHTLVRLMRRLASLQQAYILKGDAHLKPITRAQLAVELEVHESTISRAVSGKAVQLPSRKIVPLSKMFDRSLNIRTALIEIIDEEAEPLSDAQIAGLLERAVCQTDSRQISFNEGILPARLRQSAPYAMQNE